MCNFNVEFFFNWGIIPNAVLGTLYPLRPFGAYGKNLDKVTMPRPNISRI